MQIKTPLLSPVLFQYQANAGGTLREEVLENIQELPLGALTMHFSPHLSNPVFLATCKLQVPMYLQSDTFSLLRKLQTREEIFPVLFNTQQLANYLNYSFVNITSFTQPLFAVSKKELKDPNSSRSLGLSKKVFLFMGGLMVIAATVTMSTWSTLQDCSRVGVFACNIPL